MNSFNQYKQLIIETPPEPSQMLFSLASHVTAKLLNYKPRLGANLKGIIGAVNLTSIK